MRLCHKRLMTTKLPPTDELLTARVGHLNMIQGIVSRLATFSANAKNFCITVVAALIGVAFQQHLPLLLITAPFVVISFAALDIYYLAQERRFREFYREVADRPLAAAAKMDLAPSKLSLLDYINGIRSFSTGGFYLLLLIVGVALLPIVDERAEETGVGNFSRVAGSAEAQHPGESTAVAARTSADGRSAAASNDQAVRAVEGPAGRGPERPVQNSTEPVAERRDVRQQPVANSND